MLENNFAHNSQEPSPLSVDRGLAPISTKDELLNNGSFKIFREINNGKDSWIILSIYAIVFGVFLGQVFQVMYPIVNNICVYRNI